MKTHNIYQRIALAAPAASGRDMDRLFSLLTRMNFWECPCCEELFPPPPAGDDSVRFLGVCRECFIHNEDIEHYATLPATDLDTYQTYSRILRSSPFYHMFGPHGNPGKNRAAPEEFNILSVFIELIGEEEMRRIIVAHRPPAHTAYPAGPRAFFKVDSVAWIPEYGFVPHTSPTFPAMDDSNGYALRQQCWIIDPDPTPA